MLILGRPLRRRGISPALDGNDMYHPPRTLLSPVPRGSPPVQNRSPTPAELGGILRDNHPDPLITHMGNQRLGGTQGLLKPTWLTQNKRGLELSFQGFQSGALSMSFYSLLNLDY